jgi:hypothetical protein
MMNYTLEQQKIIYNAVRYYQMNRVPPNSGQYSVCDEILNGLFKEVKATYVEPAYEVQPVAPTPPVNGFRFNV